jgi:hypothetical protein
MRWPGAALRAGPPWTPGSRNGHDRRDVRVHGTTHERPIDRFARETLTPLGRQPPYQYTAPRRRIVAADALVAIAAGRYSVPVQYVGQTVHVRETATHYVIVAGDTCIAQHTKAGRHAS